MSDDSLKIGKIKKFYPTVYQALLHIAYDNGMINRLQPERLLMGAPENYIDHLPTLESQAIAIGEDLETFCVGEEQEINKICESHNAHLLGDFLTEWFDAA